jgi:hypothetical protein
MEGVVDYGTEEEYYRQMGMQVQDIESEVDNIGENINANTRKGNTQQGNDFISYATGKLNKLNLGAHKNEAVALWNSLKPTISSRETADTVIATITSKLKEWSSKDNQSQKETSA